MDQENIYSIDNTLQKIDFEAETLENRIMQNVKNLLRTRMGEIPYDRYKGFDETLYDLPIKELNDRLPMEIDRVLLWEPCATMVDCGAEMREEGSIRIWVNIIIQNVVI